MQGLTDASGEQSDVNPGSLNLRAVRLRDIEPFRRALRLDPATGDLFWRYGFREGRLAGYITEKGYRHVTVDGVEVGAHQVVWAFVHGVWPDFLIDHENGHKADNRPDNLRKADHQGNAQNTEARSQRREFPKGVKLGTKCRNAYEARIVHDGKCIYLGMFKTPEEAHAAYLAAKANLHTFQPTPRVAAE